MSKLRVFGAKMCCTVATAALFSASQVHLLRETVQLKCSSFSSMVRRISRLKIPIYRSSQCSSSNTFPNFAQEKSNLSEGIENPPVDERFPDSCKLGDEFDHEDYDEEEQYEDDYFHDYGDGLGTYSQASWEQAAVDEAIEEENNDSLGDILF